MNSTVNGQMELRAKVAELCGWKKEVTPFKRHGHELWGLPNTQLDQAWWHPDIAGCRGLPPDYPSDLNACAEFEKGLNDNQRVAYLRHLIGRTHIIGEITAAIFATAEQRCRAFIATMEGQSVRERNENQPAHRVSQKDSSSSAVTQKEKGILEE